MKSVHTHLTVLTPLETLDVETQIQSKVWEKTEREILDKSDRIHMCRFHVLRQLNPGMGVKKIDQLPKAHLMFIAEIDGRPEELYDWLYAVDATGIYRPFGGDGGFVKTIWGCCSEFPEKNGPVFFRRYMRKHQIKSMFTVAGHPEATVRDIVAAMAMQQGWRNVDPKEDLNEQFERLVDLDTMVQKSSDYSRTTLGYLTGDDDSDDPFGQLAKIRQVDPNA